MADTITHIDHLTDAHREAMRAMGEDLSGRLSSFILRGIPPIDAELICAGVRALSGIPTTPLDSAVYRLIKRSRSLAAARQRIAELESLQATTAGQMEATEAAYTALYKQVDRHLDEVDDMRRRLDGANETKDVLVNTMEKSDQAHARQVSELRAEIRTLQDQVAGHERTRRLPGVAAAIRLAERQRRQRAAQRRDAAIARRRARAESLRTEWRQAIDAGELPDSLCRAIRREMGKTGHYIVSIGRGRQVEIDERPAYHVTPGGTIVHHPNAYPGRCERVPAVNDITVGRGWLAPRLRRLARTECGC